jgi:hypothetical protein
VQTTQRSLVPIAIRKRQYWFTISWFWCSKGNMWVKCGITRGKTPPVAVRSLLSRKCKEASPRKCRERTQKATLNFITLLFPACSWLWLNLLALSRLFKLGMNASDAPLLVSNLVLRGFSRVVRWGIALLGSFGERVWVSDIGVLVCYCSGGDGDEGILGRGGWIGLCEKRIGMDGV